MSTFSERLEALVRRRIAEGRYRSKAEAARALGFSSGRFGHWTTGLNEPGTEEIVRICDGLQTHPNYLLGYSEDPDPRYTENVSRISALEKEIKEIRKLVQRKSCG